MHILILECDGIGPEIIAASMPALESANKRFGLKLKFEHDDVGHAGIKTHNHGFHDSVLDKCFSADGVIMGPHDANSYPVDHQTYPNPSSIIRMKMDLFANMRPCTVRPGVPAHVKAMDLIVARENTEGFYADRNMYAGHGEFMVTPKLAQAVRNISYEASARITRAACELAMQRRKKVTLLHKVHVMKMTDGLFLEAAHDVAIDYPEVEVEEVIVDAMFALAVRRPESFDLIVATNLYGDLLSDLTAELSGGLGIGSSINSNLEHCVAQAAHGSAPDIAGQNIANPTAMILSCGMMFTWLAAKHNNPAFKDAGQAIEAAIDSQLQSRRTRDLGGDMNCDTFGQEVAERIGNG